MTAPLESWKVLPHGLLSEVHDDDVRTVAGSIRLPAAEFGRRPADSLR